MADERDAFLREIDEEVRRERLAKLWDKYGVYVLGVAGAIILSVAGWKWYQNYQVQQAARAGAQFVEITQLLAEGKNEEAVRGFEQIASEGPSGYAQLAQLRLAAHARKEGKTDEAIAHYEALAGNAAADDLLKSFANLQIAALKVDTASWTETQNRLNDLVKDDSSWKFAARELLGLAAYKAGKFEEARKTFTELLAAPDTPASIRQRAQLVMTLVTREAAATKSDGAGGDGPGSKTPGSKEKADKAGEAKTQ